MLLENLDSTAFEVKMSYWQEYNIQKVQRFLAQPNMSY